MKNWQNNPETITTAKVQYWVNGTMMTAQMTNSEARKMVAKNEAYVITAQAIGQLINGQKNG